MFWVATISNTFGVLDIPDIFWGWTVDAWSESTYAEKMRVPPPPPLGFFPRRGPIIYWQVTGYNFQKIVLANSAHPDTAMKDTNNKQTNKQQHKTVVLSKMHSNEVILFFL